MTFVRHNWTAWQNDGEDFAWASVFTSMQWAGV